MLTQGNWNIKMFVGLDDTIQKVLVQEFIPSFWVNKEQTNFRNYAIYLLLK